MSHVHDHAAMIQNTTAMNHDHHIMDQQKDTNTIMSGHGMHLKDMMMAMTFHAGYTEKILFDQWNTTTVGAFVGSWFAVFFLAVLYEALKTMRDMLARRERCDTCSQTSNHPQSPVRSDESQYEQSSDADLIPTVRNENQRVKRARLLSIPHAIQTLLHIIQMTMSYLLMLIAMTFNVYLFLAIILGAGFGHFLFAWRRSSVIDHNEHCH